MTTLISQLNNTIKEADTSDDSEQEEVIAATEEALPEDEESKVIAPESINVTQLLFAARDQTHYWHLQTPLYAEHVALNNFYAAFLSLSDQFIECLQGLTGERTKGELTIKLVDYTDGCSSTYLIELKKQLTVVYESVTSYSDLTSILDDVLTLINQTLYLLSLK